MQDVAALVGNIAIVVFAITSMLSVGLANSLRDIIGPLRHAPGVVRALVANFLLVPALVLLVTWAIPLDEPLRHGLILVGGAAGAPFLIKLSQAADSRLDLTAGLLVLLLPVTVVYMPLVVPVLLPGTELSATAIAIPLVVTMLLPLAIGLATRARWLGAAGRLQPIMAKTSSLALAIVVLATVLANYERIRSIGWEAILAAILVIVGAFVIGYALGSNRHRREVLGLGTGQRNISAATVVASQSFGEPDTLVMVIAASLLGLAILFPIARVLRRRE